ncbi:SMP-30/gluconolactonase/LRE family protein [Janthinobacterium lividum]|uniref:SMP-30/gluconolactonase/LRE family protein n=1 Tax=Janthinobacterium lividum TaxID=29581 RepID=UPI003D646B3A
MMGTQAQLLVDAQNFLGEGVRWCERSGRVFWTNIEGCQLHALVLATGERQSWAMPERLACFALTDSDEVLLLGLASGLAWFDARSGAVTRLHTVEGGLPMTRLNDGRCDRQGRFVFGTLDERPCRDAIGSFYRLNLDLTLERLPLPQIAISNSICFSVDGTAMYFCDSMKKAIYRWDDYLGGDASRVRVFAVLDPGPGAADGATIDADDYLWSAQWGAGRVLRFAPDGSVERKISLPVSQPSCVSLGGPHYDELFVTTAQESLTPAQLASEPLAGGLFHARQVGVRGLPEVRFGALPA